ncbi:MAG: hypothetical protein QG604_282 [Candidatus Dependentiae bacterium]|nr:hypothetical protein [Candidatus Dependentiae bacterium]
MGLWSLITQKLTHQESRPELHIAILAPRSSGTIEKIINLTIQQLKATTARTVSITQFNGVTDQTQFSLFLKEAEHTHFDLIFAITGLAAAQARKIYIEHGIFIPTLIITAQELLPYPMPNHISALLIANSAPFIFQLLTTSIPKLKKLLVCTNPVLFQRTQEIADLTSLCSSKGIEIVPIFLPQPTAILATELHTHAATADALFMPIDTEAFSFMPDIIEIAREHGCPVVTSELHALHYGADIAFGYPLDSLASECAQRLLHILQYPKRDIRFIQTVREIHCRSNKQGILLRTMATQQVDYNFKIIGCTDNEESGPVQ